MFQSGHDLTILAVAAASSTAAVVAALLAGALDLPEPRAAARPRRSSRRRPGRPRADARPARARGARRTTFNEMAARLEQLFDARRSSSRGRATTCARRSRTCRRCSRRSRTASPSREHYLPALHEQVRTLGAARRRPLRARPDRRRRADARASRRRSSGWSTSCLRGLEAEARRAASASVPISATALTVRCAPDKVERVLFNLLTNALRHTPADGSVAVRVEPADDEVQVDGRGHRRGLEPDAETRMFDRFWRGDRARSSTRGGRAGARPRDRARTGRGAGGRIWAENRSRRRRPIVAFTLPVPGRRRIHRFVRPAKPRNALPSVGSSTDQGDRDETTGARSVRLAGLPPLC